MTFNDYESLLIKDSFLQRFQTKWFKNLSKGHISILEQIYTLKVTDNKRKLIYENNKLVRTVPYIIDSDKKLDK